MTADGAGAPRDPVGPDGRAAPRVLESEALGRRGPPPDATERYGAHESQVGDLRLPDGPGPHPVAVILHGGCWRAIADRGYMEPLAAALTEAGWATWNLDYRTVDHAGGGYPGTFHDVSVGVDHLRAMATARPLDLDRVVTVGHSAGGHLALWAAARPRLPPGTDLRPESPVPVRAAVGLAPIADLVAFDALDARGCGGAVRRLLGVGMAGVSRWQGTESSERIRAACPARVLPLGVPQLLVVGAEDDVVPPGHVREYAAAAREAGDEIGLAVPEGAAHFEVVAPWWSGWDGVGARILRFLSALPPD